MAITWYGNQSSADSCNFGALAVVWPLLERMQVASVINRHLPADPQAEYDHGRVLTLLMAARLYSPVALVNVPKWAAESGADILWDIPVEKLNDDRLGRSLDALFTQRHSILASVALHVSQEFGIPLSELHYDPTHIVLHGAYETSRPRDELAAGEKVLSDDALPPAHITRGRPMSDAPKDVQLIHAGLCTLVDELGPLPIFAHTVGGNQNGHTAVAEQLALIKKHLKPPKLTMISDRGTFSAGHLLRLRESGYQAIAAAPWDEMVPLSKGERDRLPPPQRGCKRPVHRFEFHYDQQLADRDAAYDGYSVLVTTAPPAQSADVLFTKYKQQCYSELANHELKTPLAVHPVFLKSPRRVEALVFLLTLSLTLYFLIQRIYRKNVADDAPTKEQRTTTQTILRAFNSYTLILHHTRLGREVQPTRLTTRQREILRQLGFHTPAQILSKRLPRAP